MNIDNLLSGRAPTLNEYADFLGICERLPYEVIWEIMSKFPNMHFILMQVARDQLARKIQTKNLERFDENLVKAFQERFNNGF